MTTPQNQYLHYWEKSNSGNNNTYKYVLALAILDFLRENQTSGRLEISYDYLLEKYIHFYWNHTNIYKLKHSVSEKQQPKFMTIIAGHSSSDDLSSLYFPNLKSKHPDVVDSITSELKKQNAYRILRNPISRFNYDYLVKNPDGDKSGKGWLYEWSEDRALIRLNEKAAVAIQQDRVLFEYISILGCVRFLETYNVTPKLSRKIPFEVIRESFPANLIHSFDVYLELMKENQCFYCQRSLETYDRDHFIPWEYVLEHKIWNLVPACADCNRGEGGKFIKIPEAKFLDKLHNRNRQLYNIPELNLAKEFESPANLEKAVDFLYENALKSGYLVWRR